MNIEYVRHYYLYCDAIVEMISPSNLEKIKSFFSDYESKHFTEFNKFKNILDHAGDIVHIEWGDNNFTLHPVEYYKFMFEKFNNWAWKLDGNNPLEVEVIVLGWSSA